MQKHISSLGLASVLSLALYSSATANPVTAKVLSGKKICWSNGNISTFSSGESTQALSWERAHGP